MSVSAYVQIGAVRTWYGVRGTARPLTLLHPGGAGVDARALTANTERLAHRFRVFTPERRGHGRTPDVPGPISFAAMAEDTIGFIERIVGGPTHLVGSSDGATVALTVALARPDLVDRLVLAAGVFHHEGWAPGVVDPDRQPPDFLADLYAQVSPDGAAHYPVIVRKLADMHIGEPALRERDLTALQCRTLVMVGDDDEVALEHAIAMYRAIPNAELFVVPGTSHGLLVEKPALCNSQIIEFLTADPVPTLAPIRRARPASS